MPSDPAETMPDQAQQLTVSRPPVFPSWTTPPLWCPRIVADAGEHAARRFLEFFAATIRNRNTRMAY